MNKNETILMPPNTRIPRKNYSIIPISKKLNSSDDNTILSSLPRTRLKPILKNPPSSSSSSSNILPDDLIEPWKKPSEKKSYSTPTFKTNNGAVRPIEKRVASLQTIKQKFMLKDQDLPWEQYAKSSVTTVNCQKITTGYDDMMQELNISHALGVASKFETMSFVEAEKLFKKFQHLKTVLETLYGSLRVQTDTTRATVMTLKLDAPQNQQFCQLNECALKIDRLLDEFYFTSKYANHLESNYFQHLAGTLSQQKKGEDTVLNNILIQLQSILLDRVAAGSGGGGGGGDIYQQLDTVIEKIRRHFKLLSLYFGGGSGGGGAAAAEHDPKSKTDTFEELTKQRERSASLVLELERNRSQRLLVNESRIEPTNATLLLQDRVTDLERALKSAQSEIRTFKNKINQDEIKKNQLEQDLKRKSRMDSEIWSGIKKRIQSQCVINNSDSQQQTIEEVVQLMVEQWKTDKDLIERQKIELKETKIQIKHYLNEKRDWLKTFHAFVDKLDDDEEEEDDDDDLQLVLKHFIHQEKKIKALKANEQSLLLENQKLTDQNLKNEELLKQEKERHEETIKTFMTRESGYILQSASTEAELERTLKEFDRLTRNIIDFNHERKVFENEINMLQQEKMQLSKELLVAQVQTIPGHDSSVHLRKEFCDLMARVKEQHSKEMTRAQQEKRELEQALRKNVFDIEMKLWEKVDVAVQTHFILN